VLNLVNVATSTFLGFQKYGSAVPSTGTSNVESAKK
jgi:hypothetical protein